MVAKMIILEQNLKEIVKSSSNISLYFIRDYSCFRERAQYPDNILSILNALQRVSRQFSFDRNYLLEDVKDELSAIKGLDKAVISNVESDYEKGITVVFDENFAVEFDLDEEHLLHGDPTILMNLRCFAIKENKTVEDIKVHLDILSKLFKRDL